MLPGQRCWHGVVDQFGDDILVAGGLDIDRKRLASIVFADPARLAALNAIVHPFIFRTIAEELEVLADRQGVAVIDAALILETGLHGVIDKLIVVVADRGIRESRLTEERGLSLVDARARMASQRTEEELVAEADIVVRNSGSMEALEAEADRVWAELGEAL